jgi:hypothetical protein
MAKSKSVDAQSVSLNTKPRCRKGDLAMHITGPDVGRIVDVIEHFPIVKMKDGQILLDAWQVKHSDHVNSPNLNFFKEDKDLLPIRPQDLKETEETDEILSQRVKQS